MNIKKEEIAWKDGVVQYLDDDGTIISISCRVQVMHYVYILFSADVPVYVGCTSNIELRIKAHKKDKIFDGYKVIYQSPLRIKSINFESVSIAFLKSFNYNINYNKQSKQVGSRIIPVISKKTKKIIINNEPNGLPF